MCRNDLGGIRRIPPALVRDLLAGLHADLRHPDCSQPPPLGTMTGIGGERHRQELGTFLHRNGQFIHALELSGVRVWPENKEVTQIAAGWNQPVISGGDRHGCEA